MTANHSSQHRAALELALKEIESLSPIFKNKSFKDLMDKIAFTSENSKEKVLGNAFPEKMDQLTLELLLLVSRLYDSYNEIYKQDKKNTDIVIKLSRTVNKDEEQILVKKIQDKRGMDVVVRFEHDPALIGGMQIYENGAYVDYSLHNSLQTLEKHLKD